MRYIESIKDTHKGKKAWLIGTGPSLDDFPREFFDDKLVLIALNWAFTVFSQCKYIHFDHMVFKDYIEKKNPAFFEKCILTQPFEGRERYDFGEHRNKPIWVEWVGTNKPTDEVIIKRAVDSIMKGRTDGYTCGLGVGLTAIQIAVTLGISEIVLVGYDCNKINLQGHHAQKWGLSNFYNKEEELKDLNCYPEHYACISQFLLNGIKYFTGALQPHGVKVRRYFYKKGYEEMV